MEKPVKYGVKRTVKNGVKERVELKPADHVVPKLWSQKTTLRRMKTIGIRELKATLSQVLREVATGDVYLVTDRGRVVAELRSPLREQKSLSSEDRALASLAAEGHLRVAEARDFTYRASPLPLRKGLARKLLDMERGE